MCVSSLNLYVIIFGAVVPDIVPYSVLACSHISYFTFVRKCYQVKVFEKDPWGCDQVPSSPGCEPGRGIQY